ncbi:MAG: thioredoxin fold domain-containing protein [Proteobacteria bacterium]|nr:thioredoxin fold domain-containing protein [Pseudomonadota bacterium]
MKTWKTIPLIIAILFMNHTALFGDDYVTAMKRANRENKPSVLYFFSNHCPYCNAMDKQVLADKEISGSLKNDVVYLRVDVEKRETLANFYGIRGYPTTLLLEPSGERIARIPGYIPKKEFKKILTYAMGRHYKVMGLNEFLRKQ